MGNVLKVIHSESCKVFLTTIVHLLESWGTAFQSMRSPLWALGGAQRDKYFFIPRPKVGKAVLLRLRSHLRTGYLNKILAVLLLLRESA